MCAQWSKWAWKRGKKNDEAKARSEETDVLFLFVPLLRNTSTPCKAAVKDEERETESWATGSARAHTCTHKYILTLLRYCFLSVLG